MAWYFDRGSGAYLSSASLGGALAGAADGAHTVAFMGVMDGTFAGNYQGLTYLRESGTGSLIGLSLSPGDELLIDTVANFVTWTTGPTFSGGDTWIWAISISGAGAGQGRWYAFNQTLGAFSATFTPSLVGFGADELLIGSWDYSDYFGGWMGVVGIWEGGMTLTQLGELTTNWRTSDWWNHSFGQPECLIEAIGDPAGALDIAGNATSLNPVALFEDAAQLFDSWTFDNIGGGGGLSISGAGNIASAQALGNPVITPAAASVSGAGNIASAQAFGTARLDLNVQPSAIASAEAVGSPVIAVASGGTITGAGAIASLEASGTPTISPNVQAAGGIASAEAIGSPVITPAAASVIGAGGIGSGEAFGLPTISGGSTPTAKPHQLPTLNVG